MDETDAAIIEAARDGDQDAFRTLYLRHAGRVFRFVGSLGVEPRDADDVVQDVFYTAFSKISSFGGEGRFFSWLCRIAVHVARRNVSRRYWRTRLLDFVRREPVPAAPPGPDVAAERGELAARVGAVLDRIGPRKRTVLVMRDVMDFDEEETAAVLRIPRGTVATRLYHARREFERVARRFQLRPREEESSDE